VESKTPPSGLCC